MDFDRAIFSVPTYLSNKEKTLILCAAVEQASNCLHCHCLSTNKFKCRTDGFSFRWWSRLYRAAHEPHKIEESLFSTLITFNSLCWDKRTPKNIIYVTTKYSNNSPSSLSKIQFISRPRKTGFYRLLMRVWFVARFSKRISKCASCEKLQQSQKCFTLLLKLLTSSRRICFDDENFEEILIVFKIWKSVIWRKLWIQHSALVFRSCYTMIMKSDSLENFIRNLHSKLILKKLWF